MTKKPIDPTNTINTGKAPPAVPEPEPPPAEPNDGYDQVDLVATGGNSPIIGLPAKFRKGKYPVGRDACLLVEGARLRIEAILHGKTPINRDDLRATFDVISKAARLLRRAEDAEVANLKPRNYSITAGVNN